MIRSKVVLPGQLFLCLIVLQAKPYTHVNLGQPLKQVMGEVCSIQLLGHFPVSLELNIKNFNNWTRRLWHDREKHQFQRGEERGLGWQVPI